MKLDDALANATRVFLDTAPVIYFVERNPLHFDRTANVFARIDRDEIIAVTSIITLAESLILPLRQKRTQLQRDLRFNRARAQHRLLVDQFIVRAPCCRIARLLQSHADGRTANRRRAWRGLRSLLNERYRLAAR